MKLTQAQIDEFREQGYLVVRGLIPPDMAEAMARGYDRAIEGELEVPAWNGQIEPGKVLQLGSPHRHIPEIASSGHLDILSAAARQILGEDMEFWYDQLIMKPAGHAATTPWHQDAAYWGGAAAERGVTCWLALAPVARDQSCMQFIPGSHKGPVIDHHSASDKSPIRGALEADTDGSGAVPVTYERGDATFHHARTLHFTDANRTDRPRKGLVSHFCPREALPESKR